MYYGGGGSLITHRFVNDFTISKSYCRTHSIKLLHIKRMHCLHPLPHPLNLPTLGYLHSGVSPLWFTHMWRRPTLGSVHLSSSHPTPPPPPIVFHHNHLHHVHVHTKATGLHHLLLILGNSITFSSPRHG